MRRLIFPLMLVAGCAPGWAQTPVISAAPDRMSVTVYRDPNRGEGAINARFPESFALISEKRRIAIPAGDSVIRFESVADGMMAVSAVVTGLPGGVVQKNRDARLLSPAALVDGRLGNSVHLRRTSRQTGQVTEQDAIIRSSAANGLVLETAQGVEALRCSGLPETIVQDRVPSGLSVTPTLSVTTRSDNAVTADVTLTYLATGFDWGASYVARLAPDGQRLDLFAWLTVANGNATGFAQADLLAVAGRVNRGSRGDPAVAWQSPSLTLQCWPEPSYAGDDAYADAYPGAPPPPPPPAPMAMASAQEIVVTSRRVAEQEDLGDLKLYRVPMPVDINASGQKQVALLHRPAIAFSSHYAARLEATDQPESRPLRRVIRFSNRKEAGAGVPLPSGALSVFAPSGPDMLLLGEAQMRDHAIGEVVEIELGESPQQRLDHRLDAATGRSRILLTNADPRPIMVEIELGNADTRLVSPSRKLVRRDGRWLWAVTVPGNGTAELSYRLK